MEKLPLEIWWQIFERIFDANPASLYRLRGVSTRWKTCIDHYLPSLHKKWSRICVQDIPQDCIDSIVSTRFSLAASPWRDSYWKTTPQLPHIPRAIHQAWISLRQLVDGDFELTKIPVTLQPQKNESLFSYRYTDPNSFYDSPVFAMNDEYLAIMQRSEETLKTFIYKLTDLTQPIRVYPLKCRNIDFYSVGDRKFIIFDIISSNTNESSKNSRNKQTVYMSEFLKNDKLEHTRLWSGYYAILENECFSYRALHFEHYIFSNDAFEKNTQVILPKQNASFKWVEITELRLDGVELLAIIEIIAPENSNDDHDKVWIFRYTLSQGSSGKLNICPHDTNFIRLKKRLHYFMNFKGTIITHKMPIDLRLEFLRVRFMTWLSHEFYDHNFVSLLTHGNHVIAGTENGKIFIFHRTVDEMIEAIRTNEIDSTKYTVINLNARGVSKDVVPIGVTYTNSKLRIIALHPQMLLQIDYPLTC